jgi:hypothetical protein
MLNFLNLIKRRIRPVPNITAKMMTF